MIYIAQAVGRGGNVAIQCEMHRPLWLVPDEQERSQVSKGLTPNELGTKLTSTDLTLGPNPFDQLSFSLSWSPVQINGTVPSASLGHNEKSAVVEFLGLTESSLIL